MAVTLNPYLSFRNTAREAMDFYQSIFGGELTRSTFGEFGASEDPAEKDLVMHSMLRTESGLNLMGADTPAAMELTSGSNFAVSLSGEDDATLRGYWEKLSQGANVSQPLMQAPWGDHFGMLVDKFGTPWMVNIVAPQG